MTETVTEEKAAAKNEQWRQRLTEQERCRVYVKQFCKDQGVTEYSFYAWRKRRRRRRPASRVEIKDDTELGLAILVAVYAAGGYQPVGVVVSINEAREIAASDMRGTMRDLEAGKTPACPERYLVWAQGLEGEYITAATIQP